MGQTDSQFKAFIRFILDALKAVEEETDEEKRAAKFARILDNLQKTLEEVIANNPQSVADYRGGKEKALGFLVGQTMKAMKGKADPGLVNQMLREMLG